MCGCPLSSVHTSTCCHVILSLISGRSPNSLVVKMSKPKPQYMQKYKIEWEKVPCLKEWLQPCSNDITRAYCKYCKCDVWAKLSDLIRHSKTEKHKRSAEPFSNPRQQKLTKLLTPILTENNCRVQATLAMYIACHTSLRSVDHINNIIKKSFADSKNANFKMHRTKCTALIRNVIGPYFLKSLIDDINGNKYSLIIDESTDVSTKKLLAVVVRYFSNNANKIIVTFLSLIEVESGKAQAIANAIVRLLQHLKLNLKDLVGIGSDNASVMTGPFNGVFEILKRDYELPHLILVRCVCHSLQLALSKATENTLPRNLEFQVRETYNWFSHSTLRQTNYQNIYGTINDGKKPLKIPKLADTRWISIEPPVRRILDQWIELETHFQLARVVDNCYSAEQLYAMYGDPNNKAYFLFLYPILAEVQKTNKLFESQNIDSTKLLASLHTLLKSVAAKVLIPNRLPTFNPFSDNISDKVDPNPYFGFEFENFVKDSGMSQENVAQIKKRCIFFCTKLFEELQRRLPSNMELLSQISLLSIEETLKIVNKKSITILAQQFFSDPATISKIENEWKNITLFQWEEKSSTHLFWGEVNMFKDGAGVNCFENLLTLAKTCFSLPHSNADVERIFSTVNIIKDKLRNKLLVRSVLAILHVRYGLKRNNACCDSFDLPKTVLESVAAGETYRPSQLMDMSFNAVGTGTEQEEDMDEIICLLNEN